MALVKELCPNDLIDPAMLRIIDRETDDGLAGLEQTSDITDLLDSPSLETVQPDQLPQVAAKLFLTEPLYEAAGHYYHLHDWVTAVMFGGAEDKLKTLLFDMWAGGWQVRLDAQGLVLCQRQI